MNTIAGPLGLLAVILALIPLFIATYLNRTMQKDIEAAETEEKRLYLVTGRRQMFAIGWKLLTSAFVLAALAVALSIS